MKVKQTNKKIQIQIGNGIGGKNIWIMWD